MLFPFVSRKKYEKLGALAFTRFCEKLALETKVDRLQREVETYRQTAEFWADESTKNYHQIETDRLAYELALEVSDMEIADLREKLLKCSQMNSKRKKKS